MAVILFRLLESPEFMTPSLLVIAAGLLWSWQRLLGALRIGLGTTTWRIYLMTGIIAAIIIFGGASLLNHEFGAYAYLDHFHYLSRMP